MHNPVYLAALRSREIDTSTAISELGQQKAKFVKALKDEEGTNAEEIEELTLAAGATPRFGRILH